MALYALILAEGLSYPFGLFGEPVHMLCFGLNVLRMFIQTIYFGGDIFFSANVPYFLFWPLRKLFLYILTSFIGGIFQIIPFINIPLGFFTFIFNIINFVLLG